MTGTTTGSVASSISSSLRRPVGGVLGYAYRHRPHSPPFDASVVNNGNLTASDTFVARLLRKQHSVRLTVHLPFVFHASSIVLGLGPYFLFDRIVGSADTDQPAPVRPPPGVTFSSPFQAERNLFHVGVSSFIGASF